VSEGALKVKIATPLRVIGEYTGVLSVQVPTSEGQIGVLPDHAGLVSELGTGLLVFDQPQSNQSGHTSSYFVVSGGLVEVQNNLVTVLADVGEEGSKIDLNRARESLDRARRRLTEGDGEIVEFDVERALVSELRALTRIRASELTAGGR
jgi:F-type H+-transporting ATPase subunit epsilon